MSDAEPAWGVFARVFPSGPPERVARDVAAAGYSIAQLNLSAIGLPTLPRAESWDCIDLPGVRAAFAEADVTVWGLSGSYNMIHPDPAVRRAGTTAVVAMIARAPRLGVTAVTLCTGSRNAERMWTPHPDNVTPTAWRDLRAELDLLLAAAEEADVLLGIEPESGNVVRDADAATRLIAELGPDADRIAIIVDAANLLQEHPDAATHAAVLTHAFDSLGPKIGALHAKDLVPWAQAIAGEGVVDYALVGRLWNALPQHPPVIVQDARPEDAGAVRAVVADAIRAGIGGATART